MALRLYLILLIAVAACGDSAVGPPDAAASDAAAPPASRDLDILFVIDNSGTNWENQQRLTESFDVLLAGLDERFAGRPNLHIGVVSGDVGAGDYGVTGCEGTGDDGRLLSQPRRACEPPTRTFIEDVEIGGVRQTNFGGTLEETFACIASLGIDGCGFQQHLKAIQLALDGHNPGNDGFLRPGAFLLIVLLVDDDDCTAVDPTVYDPNNAAVGPLSTGRCMQYGWQCDGAPITAPGTYSNCAPRTDSYIADPSVYADLLRGVKADPDKLLVAGIFPDRAPVMVWQSSDGALLPTNICNLPPWNADLNFSPNIRDRAFLDEFPGQSFWADGCDEDIQPALRALATFIGDKLNQPPLP